MVHTNEPYWNLYFLKCQPDTTQTLKLEAHNVVFTANVLKGFYLKKIFV